MDSKRIRVIVKDILDRYPLLEEDRIKLADFLANAYNNGGNGNIESLKLGITKGTAYEGSEGNINRIEIDKLKQLLITDGDGNKFLSDNGQYVEVKQGGLESIPKATNETIGGILLGYSANGKNYPIVLDANGKAYVNVPWVNTDTNTTYTKATQTKDGLMSKEDKIKLDGLTGAYIQIVTKDTYDSMELAGILDENTVYHIKG